MGFKENIKRLREQKGWTQTQAAQQADVPFRTLQNWEAGSREPRLDALKKLAAAYGVLVDELLKDEADTPKRPRKPPAAAPGPKKPGGRGKGK
jgi:transcriptional regulator with XRE-family HTH domain